MPVQRLPAWRPSGQAVLRARLTPGPAIIHDAFYWVPLLCFKARSVSFAKTCACTYPSSPEKIQARPNCWTRDAPQRLQRVRSFPSASSCAPGKGACSPSWQPPGGHRRRFLPLTRTP
jgi:hypothetical protein